MAKTAGESLVENAANEPAEEVVETTAPVETPPKKHRRKAEPVAETPPEPAPEPETPAEPPAWLTRVKDELGFENVESDDIHERLVEFALQQKRDAEELETWRRQNEPFVGYGREYLAQKPQEAPKEQAPPKPWQPPVAFPEIPQRYVTTNESGEVDWKPETPAELRAQADKFAAWRDSMVEMIAKRPDRFISEVIVPLIDERSKSVVEPFYEQRTAQTQQQQFFDQYAQQNAEWLYVVDPATNKPVVGQLSRVGDQFDKSVSFHLERGCTPQQAVQYAQFDIQQQIGQTPWQKETFPAQVREENKKRHNRKPLNGAGSIPDRSGSFTDTEDGEPQNGNLSAGRRLMDRAKRDGVPMPWEIARLPQEAVA